jgi:L-alanine-DL-glutamate epimerase-like enolase superfamily enzyme
MIAEPGKEDAMTIDRIQADHYRIPLPRPLSDSTHREIPGFELITVRVTTTDGVVGLGYTYTVGRGGRAVLALIEELGEVLSGADEGRIEDCWQRMWWALHWVGRGGAVAFAMAAVDVALWDILGRRAGLPLWRLLGGSNPKVPVYAGGIDLYFTLDELLEQTRGNLDRGFRAIKMKVGRDSLDEDVARVAAMRKFLGDGFPLMVDANMGWSRHRAVAAARALAPYDLGWLEEPLEPEDVEGHALVAAEGIPVAAGENFHNPAEFKSLIEAGGVQFPEPDLACCGGITPWMKIARLAEAHHLPVTSHGVHDLHVHLLAAVPNASYLEWHGFGLDAFIEHPLTIVDGKVTAPDRPGHGVALDWKGLDRLRA